MTASLVPGGTQILRLEPISRVTRGIRSPPSSQIPPYRHRPYVESACTPYDSGMFTQMEMHILNTLEWVIGHPTVDFFSQLIVGERMHSTAINSV
ncbi:g1 s-specific [Seiridium cupressi]